MIFMIALPWRRAEKASVGTAVAAPTVDACAPPYVYGIFPPMSSPSEPASPHEKRMPRFWAGGFLYDPAREAVFLHQRDGNTRINPFKWAFFGGLNEGDETFAECFMRELEEETGFHAERGQVEFLREYENVELSTYRVVFYVESNVEAEELALGEGAGFAWVPLATLGSIDLTEKTQEDLDFFLEHRARPG